MTDEGPADGRTTAYRGFLFADIRGFTSFAERRGNAAAAAMVSRFLEIARAAIARHEGGEVSTEGDAIHAVFASASSAVLCGLDIVDAAAGMDPKEPSRKLGLGVGIHAGEAVETAEGYIGRAVNIAARLCAAARPGEVLVSSTVKGITQASINVGFLPRGRRRFKGIGDPILVYSVVRDPAASPARTLPGRAVVGAAATLAIVVVGVAVLVWPRLVPGPAGSPSPSAAPAAQPVAIGPLRIGSYVSQAFQPPVTFDIGETGWSASRDVAEMLGLVREDSPAGNLTLLRVDHVNTNPCGEDPDATQTSLGASDIVAALRGLPHLALSDSQPLVIGGYTGEQVDVTVTDAALAACGGLAGGEVPVFTAGADVWRASPGERFRLVSVNAGDKTVIILVSADWARTPSVQLLEQMLDSGQRVLATVRF